MEKSETTYKAVVLKKFRSSEFEIVERTLPKLQAGEVLIKVYAAPLNPLDMIKINGLFKGLPVPFTPGSEASGTIVDANVESKDKFIGKKVSALSLTGTWTEYIVANVNQLIVHEDDVDLKQAACGWVNPITAYSMFYLSRSLKSDSLAVTAGNSAVGKMLLKIAVRENVPLISIVRSKKSKISELVAIGQKEEHILDSTDEDFEQQYTDLAQKLNTRCVFDCVAGPQVGILVGGLVKGGHYYNFGSLSGQPMGGIDPTSLRWGGKVIQGFASMMYVATLKSEEQRSIYEFVEKNFKTIFTSTISKSISAIPQEIAKIIEENGKTSGDGKVLITF